MSCIKEIEMKNRVCMTAFLLIASCQGCLALTDAAEPLEQSEARAALHRVVEFYRSNVGCEGAYLWRYAADLSAQEGEGAATSTSGWTQPPGTPSVGEAYLNAWRLTGDNVCLEAAIEAAHALVRSQLVSGGWSAHFDLESPGRRRYAYRVDGDDRGSNNRTTFDDNKSQSALMLLMHVDEELEFENEKIHEAVQYALARMLEAQYPNGAWPQQYCEPPVDDRFPVLEASYPEAWSRTFPKKSYTGYYTLNDNNMSYIVEMLFEANRIYDRPDCFEAALRTGKFFLAAQMPDPQPGWAQQYDVNMNPAWARKFEPPAVTGGESQNVMRTLLRIYRFTGDRRFTAPIPRALDYYRHSLLPDGRLARFYELQTNRPLYFTKDYQLTYSDADMPTHYGFKVSAKLDQIEREYDRLIKMDKSDLKPRYRRTEPVELSDRVRDAAAVAIASLDQRGAWWNPARCGIN